MASAYTRAFPSRLWEPLVVSLVGFGGMYLAVEEPNQLVLLARWPYWLVWPVVAMFGVRLWLYYRDEQRVRRFFFRIPKWEISVDDLDRPRSWWRRILYRLRGWPTDGSAFLIGRGFGWKQRHTQFIYDVDLDADFRNEVEQAIDIREEGLPFYHAVGMDEEDEIVLPREATVAHIGVEGTTRVGKTRLLEVLATQQVLRTDACVVVIDPKGDADLVNTLYEAATRAGRRFRFFSLVHPEASETINPLKRYEQPSDAANRLIRMIQPREGERDNFINFALGELITMTEAIDYLGEPMTIHRIAQLLNRRPEQSAMLDRVKARAQQDGTPRGKRIVESLQRVIEHPSEHYKKLIVTITPTLELLSTGHMGRLLCSDMPTLEWHRAVPNREVVYFYLGSMVNKERAEQVARIILEDLVSFVGRIYAHEKPEDFPEIYLHADEVGDYLTPAFINLLNKGGGAGFRAACYFQNEEDWAAVLGSRDSALRALGNLNTRIWLRTLSEMGIKNLEEASPAVQIVMTQETFVRTPRPDDPDLVFQTSANSRTTPITMPMVQGKWLKQLPKGQAFVFYGGRYFKVRLPFITGGRGRDFFRERGLRA